MSKQQKPPIDINRYLNDPDYRHKMKKIHQVEEAAKKSDSSDDAVMLKKSDYNRKKQPDSSIPKPERMFRAFVKWSALVLLLLIIAGGFFLSFLLKGLPSIEELENPQTDSASFVMSRDGEVLDKYFTENRTYVTFDYISPFAVDALIATEDHRFFNHWGIDLVRTLAIPYHLLRGRIEGGSTITQQLARNLYRKIGREVTPVRKLREMLTAIQLEKNFTKQEIIEMYLNTVEFSNSSFGIEAAAFTHYGKTASELNLNEAATLIGSLNAVFAYNPRLRTEASQRRRNVVLSRMLRHNLITEEEYEWNYTEPIVLNYNPPFRTGKKDRYFGEYVRLQIQKWCEDNGYDLFRDGLIIYTTVDSRMQRIAEHVVETQLDTLQKQFVIEWTSPGGSYMNRLWSEFPNFLDSFIEETDEYKNGFMGYKTRREVLDSLKQNTEFVEAVKRDRTRLEASFVALDPNNGHVLAWVGGSDYSKYQFDHVFMSRRQAGSTFKPFVYAVAIDNGYKPYHKFSRYPSSFYDARGVIWNPRDASMGSGPELVSLREALARSYNNVTVRLLPVLAGAPGTNRLEDLVPAGRKIAEMARNLGINKSPLITYPSIALGTAEVSLLELTSAYATFANKGIHIDPIAVTRIEDKSGNILVEFFPQYRREVLSPETAYIMIDMMRGVIRGGTWGFGTGVRLRNMGVTQDIAGKTGTTNDSADNWFIAVTPNIAMGSWVGGEDRRVRFPRNTYIGQGARSALPIVGQFILDCTNDKSIPWRYDGFEQPVGFVPDLEEQLDEELRPTRRVRTGW